MEIPFAADAFAQQIEDLFNKSGHELTLEDVAWAGMIITSNSVASIQCPSCRRLAAQKIKKLLPQMIKHALAQPIQHDQQHIH